MSIERESYSYSGRRGCASTGCVVIAGLALSLFGAAIGGGCSVKVPFTESNITAAGSVGSKDLSKKSLPNYVSERVASNEEFINQSATLTIGPAEGTEMFVIGKQPGAPAIDLNLNIQRK